MYSVQIIDSYLGSLIASERFPRGRIFDVQLEKNGEVAENKNESEQGLIESRVGALVLTE